MVVGILASIAGILASRGRVPASPLGPGSDDAERWFVSQRAFPGREIPAGVLDRAVSALRAVTKSHPALAVTGDTWVSIGPQPINDPATRSAWSGRVIALAAHPTDPNTLYLGAELGGVWKSGDAGQTWSMMTPDLVYPAIRTLAVDPVNPDIVYAATSPAAYPSRFLRSTDGGRGWQETELKEEQGRIVAVLYKILIDPRRAGSTSASTLYLQRGGWLYRSDDSGRTIRTVLATLDADTVTNSSSEFLEDVVLDPANPDTLFVIAARDKCPDTACADRALILYRSTDGGARWSQQRVIGVGDHYPDARIVASAGAGHLLIAFRDSSVQKVRLLRSTDMGDTWTELNTLKPSSFAWPVALALNATADTVYLGNLGLSRSSDWGQTWTDMGALHADETLLAFDASNRLLLGSDGGLFRAGSPGGSWSSLNNALSITECYSVAAHPTNSARVLIGTQDNGTVELQGSAGWSKVFGGDGGEVIYDPTPGSATITYIETQWDSTGNYNFLRCVDGACTRRVSGLSTSDIAPFIPRFTMDPSNAATLYLTAEHLYRTDDRGVTWTQVTQSVRTNQRCWMDASGSHCANANYFTAVAVAPTSSQVVYAGTLNGDVWASTNRGASWKSVAGANAGPFPVRPVKEIAIDPADPRIAYVAFGGYDASNAGRGHVFRTSDGGDTWRDLSGDLPDINVSALLIDPDATPRVIYAGTDIGVFRATDDGSGTWQSYNSGLPPVVVTRFAYNRGTRTLLAATYGRGVWATR